MEEGTQQYALTVLMPEGYPECGHPCACELHPVHHGAMESMATAQSDMEGECALQIIQACSDALRSSTAAAETEIEHDESQAPSVSEHQIDREAQIDDGAVGGQLANLRRLVVV